MALKITLRPWQLDDLNQLVKNANNLHIANNMTDRFPHPYGMKDGIKFIELTMQKEPRQILAIDLEGKSIGAIGLHPLEDIYRLNSELGYWLGEKYWGKGITTEAVLQMVDYGFRTFELERIFARPFKSNIASQRVLEKAGFKLEASFENILVKNGVYESQQYYAIRKNQ